jgi:Ran GTPase-activating protein (RanGAP) involved in mRNA processing and transport
VFLKQKNLSKNKLNSFVHQNNLALEEIQLTSNQFGLEGCVALGECVRLNRKLKSLDLANNRLTYECIKPIAHALRTNSSLRSLNVSLFSYHSSRQRLI